MQIPFILINITDILPCLKKKLQVDNFSLQVRLNFLNFTRMKFQFFRTLASYGKTIKNPLLKELAKREEANKSGKMTVNFFFLPFHLQKNAY